MKNVSASELCATRFRQIHLDFHTSPLIPDVGKDFNAKEFARTLNDAKVNWVTLFGKCHHGMSYYPTKVGVRHPSLKYDLLGEQIEACKKYGIATPVYISVRVDQHSAETHQEWVGRMRDGKLWGIAPLGAGWYHLCMNHKEYVDYVEAQTYEVLKNYNADGIFFDMCYFPPDPGCFCMNCIQRMRKEGIDINDDYNHKKMEIQITREYTTRLARTVKKIKSNATVFFNGRITQNVRKELDVFTHLEVESLPVWGYFMFPFKVRGIRSIGMPTQGMTARFHLSWADFGGIKTPEQLEYEAGTILASGSVMNIGDQLHPRGVLDKAAYETIGKVYKKVEEKEPWCLHAKGVAEVAVLMLPDKPGEPVWSPDESSEGAGKILLGLKHQWNVEVSDSDFSGYKVLIIPDRGKVDARVKEKLLRFVDKGGAIVFSNTATLDEEKGEFLCPGAGVKYKAKCEYTPSFMKLGKDLGKNLPDTELVMYEDGSYVSPVKGAQTFGNVCSSYFNRDYRHFCSHFQTPFDKVLKYPVAVKKGNVIYVYSSIFKAYNNFNFFVYKGIISNLLNMVLPNPLIRAECPSAMEVSLTRQEKENRLIVHLVNFQPQRQTGQMQYIENVWPVRDIALKVRYEKTPKKIYLAPQLLPLDYKLEDGYISIVVPRVKSHQMVAIE